MIQIADGYKIAEKAQRILHDSLLRREPGQNSGGSGTGGGDGNGLVTSPWYYTVSTLKLEMGYCNS